MENQVEQGCEKSTKSFETYGRSVSVSMWARVIDGVLEMA